MLPACLTQTLCFTPSLSRLSSLFFGVVVGVLGEGVCVCCDTYKMNENMTWTVADVMHA
jgi:hypothetical protein